MNIDDHLGRIVREAVAQALAEHRCACTHTLATETETPRVSYTVQETADRLGLHYKTVLAMSHSGEIPSRYFGRHLRIPAGWVHAQRVEAAAIR